MENKKTATEAKRDSTSRVLHVEEKKRAAEKGKKEGGLCRENEEETRGEKADQDATSANGHHDALVPARSLLLSFFVCVCT